MVELVGFNHRHLSIDFNCCLLCARFHITIKLRFKQKGVQMQSRLLHQRASTCECFGSVYAFNYTEHIRIYPLKDSQRLRNSIKHWAYKRIRSSVMAFYPSVYRLFRHLDKRASSSDREHQESSSGDLKSPLVPFLGRSPYVRRNTPWGSREGRTESQWTRQITEHLSVVYVFWLAQ